jgi:hypothetical protein
MLPLHWSNRDHDYHATSTSMSSFQRNFLNTMPAYCYFHSFYIEMSSIFPSFEQCSCILSIRTWMKMSYSQQLTVYVFYLKVQYKKDAVKISLNFELLCQILKTHFFAKHKVDQQTRKRGWIAKAYLFFILTKMWAEISNISNKGNSCYANNFTYIAIELRFRMLSKRVQWIFETRKLEFIRQ